MADKVTIYALKDPATGEVRYVGKANDLESRIRGHRWDARSSRLQNHKVRWLRTLDGDPIVEILEIVPRSIWMERECFWIKKFRDEGARLTNISDGGENTFEGKHHTAKTKAKLRAFALARGIKPPSRAGAIVSEVTRLRLGKAAIRRGAVPPPMGGWNKGQKQTHCKRGHELNSETAYYRDGRYRYCKVCQRQHVSEYAARQRISQQRRVP